MLVLLESDDNVEKAAKKLEQIVKRYKKYERLDREPPPKVGTYWSPADGSLRVVRDVFFYSAYFTKKMALGVHIGSKFAEPKGEPDPKKAVKAQMEVVSKIRDEVRDVLMDLIKSEGGSIEGTDGTSYSLLGWVAKD